MQKHPLSCCLFIFLCLLVMPISSITANTDYQENGDTADTTIYSTLLPQVLPPAIVVLLLTDPLDTLSPLPGNSGSLTTVSVAATSLTLNWTKATDNISAQSALEYRVYRSTSDNIDSVTNIEANGTPINSYTNDIATLGVTGLTENTTYYFNLIVRDEAGNKTAYTAVSQATTDGTAPTAGGSGTITTASVAATSLTLNWTKAIDNVSAQSALEYRVYSSTSNNIDSVANMEANGTAINSYTADIATLDVTGLTGSTTYYFNLIVKDEAGNKAAYSTVTQATTAPADATPPTAGGGGTITTANVAATSLTLNWAAATDNTSAQANLQYLVYYSTSNDITSVANMEANGTAVGSYTANITTQNVTGLTASTTYYFNVIVRDEAGNKTAYAPVSDTTFTLTSYLYRAEYANNTIVQSNLDGSGATTLVADAGGTGGYGPVAIAAGGGYVFWKTDNTSTIQRVDYDGSNQNGSLIATSLNVYSIFVDETNSKIYWADYETNSIRRANLDGTGAETIISTVDDSGGGPMAVVSDGTYVYWTTDLEKGIERALLNGTGETTIVATSNLIYGLSIDTDNNKLYYADYDASSIVQVNTDGTGATNVVTGTSYPGAYDGLEYSNGVVYWSETGSYHINSHNADGSGSTATIDSDGDYESGVCVGVVSSAPIVTPTAYDVTGYSEDSELGNGRYSKIADYNGKVSYQFDISAKITNGVYTIRWDTGNSRWEIFNGTYSGWDYYHPTSTDDDPPLTGWKRYTGDALDADFTLTAVYETDVTAPTAGGGGTLTTASVTSTSLTLNWTKATDNTTASTNLEYQVYYSTTQNISVVYRCETNGTAFGSYTADIASMNITGLSPSTTYYFNVVVRDEANNKVAYTYTGQATTSGADTTDPTVGGGGTITTASVAETSLTLNWTAATDDTSAQSALEYKVYRSTSSNIDTVANIETNGTAINSYTANIATLGVTGLTGSTTYYFNVIVRDEAGNKTAYTTVNQATTAASSVVVTGYSEDSNRGNATYAADGIYNSNKVQYRFHYTDGTNTYDFYIRWTTSGDKGTHWHIVNSSYGLGDDGWDYYHPTDTGDTPPTSGWYQYNGGTATEDGDLTVTPQ